MIKKIKKLTIVTDAWEPQINGVVRTLQNTVKELKKLDVEVQMITPLLFKTIPCPTYPEIRLSLVKKKKLEDIINSYAPNALHIATEGPLGWTARSIAKKRNWSFTSAYHTRFPEYIFSRIKFPLSWSYYFFKKFHNASSAVLVPTKQMIKTLERRSFKNLQHWSRGVDHSIFKVLPKINNSESNQNVFLYTGRVAIEKNIEDFLNLDLPGKKIVAGEGPMLDKLKIKYPEVNFLGIMSQNELAKLYNQADVFVFPSLTDTFGLVMVEAMACGLPVAAYPVEGPIDVVGQTGAGSLNNNLKKACLEALKIKKDVVLERAKTFTWKIATRQFYNCLVDMR